MSLYPYPYASPGPAQWLSSTPDLSSSPSPIYTILITGMVLFMASNVMPNLLPAPDRTFNVAPRMLFWGFWLIILTLLAQMTGAIPGVPQLHLTYVHMTVAALIFILMWYQLASEVTPAPPDPKPSSSSSSSSSKDKEKPKESKSEKKAESAPPMPSPWNDLRAHPSAFLTTRLNRGAMWPFPMGRAGRMGSELWWESGMPSHVGHFNKPETPPEPKEDKKKSDDRDKDKEKEKAKEKEKEKMKEAEKLKEAEKAKMVEKEAIEKKKKEEEMKKMMEAKKAASGNSSSSNSGSTSAGDTAANTAEEKQKQKLWRTKALVMIVGISLLNKSLGFFLLLFFSIQMISQELNGTSTGVASPSSSTSSSSSSSAAASSSSRASATAEKETSKAKLAKMQAMKEAEKTKSSSGGDRDRETEKEKERAKLQAAKEAEKAKSSSSSSSSSSSREKEKEKEGSSSSSSKSKSDLVTSDAVREAAGSKTKTPVDEGGEDPIPYSLGMDMHYIHTRAGDGNIDDTGPAYIPAEGPTHPLMTSLMRGWAG